MSEHGSHLKRGIGYILLAWLFFTSVTTLSRYASATASIPTILLIQNIICSITMIPWLIKHGKSTFYTERIGLIIVRSVTGLLSFACAFLAVQRISLVNAVLLNNTAPLLVPFVVWIWLKAPINHKLWGGIALGFIGVMLILKPGKGIADFGAIYGLLAGMFLSIVMVSIRLLSYTERNHTVLLYYFLISIVLCLPLSIYYWQPHGHIEWLQLLAIGVLSAFGQWAFVRAFHHVRASILAPFCFSSVIYSVIFEWFLFNKVPDLMSCIGILLVCLGGIWTLRVGDSSPPKTDTSSEPNTFK